MFCTLAVFVYTPWDSVIGNGVYVRNPGWVVVNKCKQRAQNVNRLKIKYLPPIVGKTNWKKRVVFYSKSPDCHFPLDAVNSKSKF